MSLEFWCLKKLISFAATFTNFKYSNMNLRFLFLTLLIPVFQLSFAGNPVDVATAQKTAKNIYFERSYQSVPMDFSTLKISDIRTESIDGETALYIFNFTNGGFVVVSADDALPPVLGYDLEGYCPEEGVNINFDSFIAEYSDQVEFIRTHNIDAEPAVAQLWEKYSTNNPETLAVKTGSRSVDPLLINLWNQDSPYNMMCPEDAAGPGGHVYAGCVATAMSMVMHYWRYPLQGTGNGGYNCEGYGYLSANYGETEYKFEHMQTEMDADMPEIAILQYHCGVSVEMMYGADGSGAYSWNVPSAIKNHFGYSNLASYKQKENYNQTNWVNLLKDQIDLGQPMYYSGFSNSGGHAFVCDGYDDANLFHFNFGWSGSSNGFYTLYEVGGFSSGQGAVINFIPGGDYPYTLTGQQVITGKSGSIEDGSGPVADYMDNGQTSWLISPQSPEDSITSITLTFDRFDLSTDDNVTIYDGASETASVLGTFTGNEIPEAVTTTGNELLVVFQSNSGGMGNGFLAEFSSESPVWCSGMTMLSEPTGELSDGSYEFHYDNNANCKWMISPEDAVPTTLYFTAFDTEPNYDKLLVYDLDGMAVLAQISGHYENGEVPEPVTSPSGKFFIAFVSNNGITGQGFDAYYAPVTVGIEDSPETTNELALFPNPASDRLTIKLPGNITGESRISIFNITGAKVFEQAFTSNGSESLSMDIADFQPGLYVVIVRNGDRFYRRELAIQ